MFNRTQNNLKNACGDMYAKMEKSLKLLRRIYFIEIIVLLIVGGAIGVFMSIYAAPNKSFVYQGRVTGADYLPLDDGTYYMRVKLHTTLATDACAWSTGALATGANCAAANAVASVPVVVTRGTFSIPIGDTSYDANMPNIASLDFKNISYFLEASFAASQSGTYETLTPRTKLGASASAVTVLDALQANTYNTIPASPTQLNGALTDSATTITVDSTTGYPSAGTLAIENEVVTYTATTATTFTGVVRARFGTVAAAHGDNIQVKTYLFSGAADATTRPVFFVTSDGNTFINSNASTINPQIGFQVSGTTNYALGIDRTGDANIFKLGTSTPTTNTLLALDARSTFASGGTNSAFTFYGLANTLTTAASSDDYSTLTVTPSTTTLAGATSLTAMNAILFNKPTIDPGTLTVGDASTLAIAGPPLRSGAAGTISNSYGLKINTAAVGTTTSSYGLAVATPTGATNNYSAIFTGGNVTIRPSIPSTSTAPLSQLYVAGSVPSGETGHASTNTFPNAVKVQGNYAYVVNVTGDTLQIFDVSNPASPASIGSISTGVGTNPQDVSVSGRYAYVVNYAGTIKIYDISNPASPTLTGSVNTGTNPRGIFVQGRYAYVVDDTTNLIVTDISNPASPTLISTTNIGTANSYNIFVQGKYAYFFTNGASSLLKIYNISDPATPAPVSSTDVGSLYAYSIFVQGRYAYFANGTAPNTFRVYDISNPSSPTSAGSLSLGNSSAVWGVYVQGRYAYVTDQGSPTYLRTIDISNPASPTLIGSTPSDSGPRGIFVQGRYAYSTGASADTLQIFDLGGAYIQQAEMGGLEMASGDVRSNFTINNILDVRGGINIGLGGLYSAGPLTATGLNTAATASALDIRNSAGTNLLYMENDGRLGLGITTPSSDLSFSGSAARTIGMEAATGGAGLSFIIAGSAGAADINDRAGGTLILASGESRGTAASKVQIQVSQSMSVTSNSTLNTLQPMLEFVNGHIAAIPFTVLGEAPLTPAVVACDSDGLAPLPSITGSDLSGKVTIPDTGTTDCTVNFARSYATAPACFASYEGSDTRSVRVSSINTTDVTFTFSSALASSAILSYYCIGIGGQ